MLYSGDGGMQCCTVAKVAYYAVHVAIAVHLLNVLALALLCTCRVRGLGGMNAKEGDRGSWAPLPIMKIL